MANPPSTEPARLSDDTFEREFLAFADSRAAILRAELELLDQLRARLAESIRRREEATDATA